MAAVLTYDFAREMVEAVSARLALRSLSRKVRSETSVEKDMVAVGEERMVSWLWCQESAHKMSVQGWPS